MSWSIAEISALQKDFESLQRNLDLIYKSLTEGHDPQELLQETTKKFQLLSRKLKGKVPLKVLNELDQTAAKLVELAKLRITDIHKWRTVVGAPFEQARKAILTK